MEHNESNAYPSIGESWGIMGIIFLASVLSIPVFILLDKFMGKDLASFFLYPLVLGGVFYLVHRNRKRITNESSYNFSLSTIRIMILVSLATIGLQIGVTIPIVSIIPMPEWIEKFFMELFNNDMVYDLILAVIAAPILEELIFRGIILDGFLRRYSPMKSILYSSFLFGIFHLNPWQFVSAMVIGVFSGWVYYRTRKLSLCILIHFANNFFTTVVSFFMDEPETMNDSMIIYYGGLAPVLISIVVALLGAFTCIFLLLEEFDQMKMKPWRKPISVVEQGKTVDNHPVDGNSNSGNVYQ